MRCFARPARERPPGPGWRNPPRQSGIIGAALDATKQGSGALAILLASSIVSTLAMSACIQESRQLGDLAGYAPSFIKSHRLGNFGMAARSYLSVPNSVG